MSIEESLRIVPRGEIALIEWDLVGERANKLSSPIMMRFKEIIGELKKSSYKAVVMISRKPKIFIAGADIDEIQSLNSASDFSKAVANGQEVMNQVEDLPMPVIVAIHGACMGGGCELSLACDYRIASDGSETKIGLPETKLGIIPGFGGCVRLPRVVGLQASLDIILAGKAVPAKKALKMGLVDRVVHPGILEEQAIKWAEEIIAKGGKKRRKTYQPKGILNQFLESFAGRSVVFNTAQKGVLKLTHGHYPAPLKALDVVKKTYGLPRRERAMEIEREGFCEVATTDVSKNLIQLFFMTEAIKKQSGVSNSEIKPQKVSHVGVLGAGTMGGGIAYVSADNGIHVRMKDLNNQALGIGFKAARKIWEKKLKRRRINKYQLQQKMDLVSGGTDYSGFKQMQVVIEAIVENMEIKKKVIAETVEQMDPNAIIATNTSSLSVTEMAKAHPNPKNFVGMHFFNPVDKMPLVEVIRGPETSDEATATVFDLSKRMGKIPVVVKDGPGFLVNRLLLPYLAEAAFLLEEGMAIEKVDRWYVKSFGMPMGPFTLMDEIGLDVCLKVLKIFKQSLGARIEIAESMTKLEECGRLGKKNKKGFYHYDAKGKRLEVDTSIYADLGLSSPTNKLTEKECLERGIFAMINEASMAFHDDKIVETPQEVDLAMIMGTGFPPFRGGLLKYADSLGSEYVADQLEVYASNHGQRLKPSNALRNMAKTQRKFY